VLFIDDAPALALMVTDDRDGRYASQRNGVTEWFVARASGVASLRTGRGAIHPINEVARCTDGTIGEPLNLLPVGSEDDFRGEGRRHAVGEP